LRFGELTTLDGGGGGDDDDATSEKSIAKVEKLRG